MTKLKICIILFSISILNSCDPKTYGTIVFVNYSNQAINVRYKAHFENTDTSIVVQPDFSANLLIIDHWGNPKKFECCPCEFDSLIIKTADTTLEISKDINASENWIIDKSKIRMLKNQNVDCYFELYNLDIK